MGWFYLRPSRFNWLPIRSGLKFIGVSAMPIMPDHAQARRCRIGIDLLPKLLGAADP